MTAEEFDDHVAYMGALADRLRRSGELIEERALTDEADWVRWDGDDRPAVVEGPIEESKALVAGFMGIDVVDRERAVGQAPHVQFDAVESRSERGLKAGQGVFGMGAGRPPVSKQERHGTSLGRPGQGPLSCGPVAETGFTRQSPR